jgi:hypothetical protein
MMPTLRIRSDVSNYDEQVKLELVFPESILSLT